MTTLPQLEALPQSTGRPELVSTPGPGPARFQPNLSRVADALRTTCSCCNKGQLVLLLDCGHMKGVEDGWPETWMEAWTDCRTCEAWLRVNEEAAYEFPEGVGHMCVLDRMEDCQCGRCGKRNTYIKHLQRCGDCRTVAAS